MDAKDFNTLADVRRELTELYWLAKRKTIDVSFATRLSFLLQTIGFTLRNEIDFDVNALRAEVDRLRTEINGAPPSSDDSDEARGYVQ